LAGGARCCCTNAEGPLSSFTNLGRNAILAWMNSEQLTPTFRTEERIAAPVTAFHQPADVFEALFQSIQGGESHARPTLDLAPDSPFLPFLEIGYALRACLEKRAHHDYLIERLRPHLSVMVGTL